MVDEILIAEFLQNFYRYGLQDTIYPVPRTPSQVRIRIPYSTIRSLFVLYRMRNILNTDAVCCADSALWSQCVVFRLLFVCRRAIARSLGLLLWS